MPIVGAALILAVLAAFGAYLRPATYSATATVRVTLLQSAGAGSQNYLATNELAAQYAQLATTEPVTSAVAKELDLEPRALKGSITANPVESHNIVAVTATADSAAGSANRANATADALMAYITDTQNRDVLEVVSVSAERREALDRQIAQLQEQIAVDEARAAGVGEVAANAITDLAGERALLAALVSSRENIFTASERSLLSAQPRLEPLDRPSEGSISAVSTSIYAGVALMVGLLLAAEVAYLWDQRAREAKTRSRRRPG